jgi:integrase
MSAHKMAHMRGRGEGSIYRRADGYWVGACEAGQYPNGRRRRVRVVRRRRADVLEAMDALRRDAQQGITGDRTRTLATYLDWWLDDVVAGQVTAGSLREYRKHVARIIPHIGKVKLAKLNATHIQTLATALTRRYPRSPATRASTLATLRRALRWAVGAQLIPRSPAEHIATPRAPIMKVDDTLTADEANAVLRAALDDTELGAFWWLALTYGLRLGELLDLRWADVDLADEELTVRRAKTRAGVRTLPLTPEAMRVLQDHRETSRQREVLSIEDYVFPSPVGARRTQQGIRDDWNALLRQAGVRHVCRNCGSDDRCSTSVRRFHSSRHTAATMLLERGVSLEVTSAILGHSNIGMTADVYTKIRSDLLRKGLAKVDRGPSG